MNEITLKIENLLFEDFTLVKTILKLSGFKFASINKKDEWVYCNSKNQVLFLTVDEKKNEVIRIYIK